MIAFCLLIAGLFASLLNDEIVVKFYFVIYLLLAGFADYFYFSLFGQAINFLGLVNAVLICKLVFKFGSIAKVKSIYWPRFVILPIFVFMAVLFLLIPFSTDIVTSLRGINRIFSALSLYLIAYLAVATDRTSSERIFNFVIKIFVFLSIYGLIEYLSGFNILKQREISSLIYSNYEVIGSFKRIGTTFLTPSTYSFAILMIFPLFLYKGIIKSKRSFWIGGLLLLGANLIFTFTRISWIAAVIQIAFFLILFKPKRILSLTIALIILVFFMATVIMERLTGVDSSVQVRGALFRHGMNMFKSRPLFGSGLETFLGSSKAYFGKSIAAHGDYMRLFAETGIFGGAAYLHLLLKNIVYPFKCIKISDFAKVSFMTIMGFMIFSITDNGLAYSHIFWGLMGIYTAIIVKDVGNKKTT